MNRIGRVLSHGFIRVMLLLGMFGIGLWALAQIVSLSSKVPLASPVGAVASRYRRFATTGS